jgi:hypothetical protein
LAISAAEIIVFTWMLCFLASTDDTDLVAGRTFAGHEFAVRVFWAVPGFRVRASCRAGSGHRLDEALAEDGGELSLGH